MLNLIIDVACFELVMFEDIARLNSEESEGTSLPKALEHWEKRSLFPRLHMLLRLEKLEVMLPLFELREWLHHIVVRE